MQREFRISQPAVSQHLRVLRATGRIAPTDTRRCSARAVEPAALQAADAWFDPFRRFWQPHLDALGTGSRARTTGTPTLGRAEDEAGGGCRGIR